MLDEYKEIENMLRRYISLVNKIKNIDLEIEKLGYNNCVPDKSHIIKSLNKEKREKEIEVQKIDNALAVLDTRQRKIIELRYILPERLDWNKIADAMQLTDVTCRTVKNEAIKKMAPVIFLKK